METKKTLVKQVKIERDVVMDGLTPSVMKLKVLPKVDGNGNLTGPLISGLSFSVKPDGLVPNDFDGAELILIDPETGKKVAMGRPVYQVSGTMTLNIRIEREELEVIQDKKHK